MSDYPDGMALRPIEGWPHEFTRNRRRAQFSATLTATLTALDRELGHLGARRHAQTVLQLAIREQDFRLDGMPRARAIPDHPGVILSIESKHGPLSYPCDTFTRWQDNLRAITLGLEALRRVERYGITQTGQQYRGWQAIESKPAAPAVTAKAAIERLARIADTPPASTAEGIALAARKARAAAHPDRNGGSRALWDEVEKLTNFLHANGWLDL